MPSDSNKISSRVEYISNNQYSNTKEPNANTHNSPIPINIKDEALWGSTNKSVHQYTTIPLKSGTTNHGGIINGVDSTAVRALSSMLSLGRSGNLSMFREMVSQGDFADVLDRISATSDGKLYSQTLWISTLVNMNYYNDTKLQDTLNNKFIKMLESEIKRNAVSIDSSLLTYEMTYSGIDGYADINQVLSPLHRSLHIYDDIKKPKSWYWEKYCSLYNRFKVSTTDDALARGFGHVFFTRPDCNIFSSTVNTTDRGKLSSSVINKPIFVKAYNNNIHLLYELSKNVSTSRYNDSHFMLSLSNKANNFSVNEDYIATAQMGKTYTGYQITYGKNNIESKSAGTFNIEFTDDGSLHIYELTRLWLEYISGCYRGSINPTEYNILHKILDYASSLYYVITDETGENIIYWEKYYGVFPSNVSNDSLAWSNGQPIQNPKFNVTFQYSFRSSFDPSIISEFNYNSFRGRDMSNGLLRYVPVYDKELQHTADSWVGVPFIETVTNDDGSLTYKLRFREPNGVYQSNGIV